MNGNLAEKSCVPCRGGTPSLGEDESQRMLKQLGEGWEVIDNHHLRKTFRFKEFMEAIEWVNALADTAEQEGHHPNISIDYNKVTVEIWTHKIDGLTESDFILAAKADAL